jgi:hypothetical protein
MTGTGLMALATTLGIVGYGVFLLWFCFAKVAHRPAPRARRRGRGRR